MPMNWNEFRKAHKGTEKKEISRLWKLYKNGEYEHTEGSELLIDPNHGHDLEYIAKAEEEMKRDEKEQQFLNKLNKKELHTGLRSITHW